jgi:hypothetical protein
LNSRIIKFFDTDNSLERLDLLKKLHHSRRRLLNIREQLDYSFFYRVQIKFAINVALLMAFERIDKNLDETEISFILEAKTWRRVTYEIAGMRILNMFMIYSRFSGHPDREKEFHVIARIFQTKATQQEYVQQQGSLSRILELGHLQPIGVLPNLQRKSTEAALSVKPKELMEEVEPSAMSTFIRGITWSKEFWALAGGAGLIYSMNYFSKPPQELSILTRRAIEKFAFADLETMQENYSTGWWVTQIHYDIVQYHLLALFSLIEQEELLAKALSTPEFTVSIAAENHKITVSIKAKLWVPNWQRYLDHLQDVSTRASASLEEKVGDWFKLNLSNIEFKKPFKVHCDPQAGYTVSFKLGENPYLHDYLFNVFKKNHIAASLEYGNLLIPYGALEPEDGFVVVDFRKNLQKANDAWGELKNKIEKDFERIQKIAAIIPTSEREYIHFDMDQKSCKWHLASDQNYVVDGIVVSKDSMKSLIAYLLYKVYKVNVNIEPNCLSHALPQEEIKYKEEPGILIENVMPMFKLLKERYAPARCELAFINKKIQMRVSFDETLYRLNTEELFDLIKGEMGEKGFLVTQDKPQSLLVDLSMGEKDTTLSFTAGFGLLCQEIGEKIELEHKEKDEALKALDQQNVQDRLNRRLNKFIPDQELRWKSIEEKEGIRIVLTKENYYAEDGLQISQNALIELIKNDLQKNGAIEEKYIFSEENRVELRVRECSSVKMNDDLMEKEIFKALKKLALYAPMKIITLDYRDGGFKVCLQLEEEGEFMIEPYGLSGNSFVDCVQESLKAVIGEESKEIREGLQLTIPLRSLDSITLPEPEKFLLEKQQRLSADILPKKQEEDKGKCKERKGKRKNAKFIPPTISMAKCKPKHLAPVTSSYTNQHYSGKLSVKFNQQEAKNEIDELFMRIEDDLNFFRFLEENDSGVKKIKKQYVLYMNLSSLLEKLVKCDSQFKNKKNIKPKWFNITDPDMLPELRARIIKNINQPHHFEFCKFVAEKILNMTRATAYLINIKDIIETGLSHVVIRGYSDKGKLETNESDIDYDEINAHVLTLRTGFKDDPMKLHLWIQEDITFVLGLIVRTSELFNKKNSDSAIETKSHLGKELYSFLQCEFRELRNSAVHEHTPLKNPEPEISRLMKFIEALSKVSVSMEQPLQSDRYRIFDVNRDRAPIVSPSSASSSHASSSSSSSSSSNSIRR